MRPVRKPEMDTVLAPPPGTEDYVAPLPVSRRRDQVSCCWKMSFRERLVALFTGEVWLDCLGSTMPPVRARVAKWHPACLFGHRWRMVYKNPYSQHPIPCMTEDDMFVVECGRCLRTGVK